MSDDPHRTEFVKARTDAQQGRLDEAIAGCERILAGNPTHRGAMDLLGFAHFFKGEYAVAESWCRRTLEAHPDHPYALKGLGLCVARQDRLEEGLGHLRRAIALDPKWFDPYWDTAVVLRDAGRLEEALGILRQGRVACPDHAGRAARFEAELERRLRPPEH